MVTGKNRIATRKWSKNIFFTTAGQKEIEREKAAVTFRKTELCS